MYLHKDNRELFRDAILITSEKLNVSEDIVEKDYYVTLILQKLATIDYSIVFKGGTSLSKAYKIIDRFSEDIDITFTEHLGEARRKKLKYNILRPIADDLGFEPETNMRPKQNMPVLTSSLEGVMSSMPYGMGLFWGESKFLRV